MALVAYDYSDSSDVDEGNEDTTFRNVKPDQIEKAQHSTKPAEKRLQSEIQNTKAENIPERLEANSSKSLFNLLPQPSQKKQSFEEDDDEFLKKKESLSNIVKPKAKITVPSLSDFKDVEPSTPSAKPKVSNGKKSGLLSILPQPRNTVSAATTTKSFVPHVLTQKPTASVKKKSLPSPIKKIKTEDKSMAQDSDDSDDGEMQNDFFSINKVDDAPIEDMPLDIELKQKEVKVKGIKTEREPPKVLSYFKQEIPEIEAGSSTFREESAAQYVCPQGSTAEYKHGYDAPEAGVSNSNEMVLDDEAILKLCGTRGKRKREDIQIVDVNQKEVLADAREWLLKGLMDDTTKRVSVSKRRGDEPTSQQRRKHQITYLAHQAKANEAELQNQWANNRMTKRQTQSKYGF